MRYLCVCIERERVCIYIYICVCVLCVIHCDSIVNNVHPMSMYTIAIAIARFCSPMDRSWRPNTCVMALEMGHSLLSGGKYAKIMGKYGKNHGEMMF